MEYDIIIIGGGIAGISAAAKLAPLGKVLILEAEEAIAYHASGRSAALYEPNYGLPPLVSLSKASGPALAAIENVLSPRRLMMVARAGERDAFLEELDDMEFREIALEEAVALLPILNRDSVIAAAIADGASDIDTDLLLGNFLRDARSHGAVLLTRARVERITRLATGWQVVWQEGEASAPLLVNAAGAWVDEIAKLAGLPPLGFTPLRRSMARIPAPEGHDVRHWPMLFGVEEGFYMKPDAGALIVSPAEEDPVEFPHDAWADDMVLAEGLARYESHVTTEVTRLIASWAGLRTFAPDRVPVIGRDPRAEGFFWLGGQGGYGFQTSPAISDLVGDLVAGQPLRIDTALQQALAPERFL